jgi:hypothetical protein
VPEWTSDPDKALTSVKAVKSDNNDPNYSDVASGAGGKYRYLIPEVDKSKSKKIGKMTLWRFWNGYRPATERITSDDWTADINDGRGGDYLYLGWNYYVKK